MVEFESKTEIYCYGDAILSTPSQSYEEHEYNADFRYPIKELFRDGKRRIDFVLVYQMETQIGNDATLDEMELEEVDLEKMNGLQKYRRRRYFLEELECVGLEMEEEILEMSRIGDKKLGKLRKLFKRSKEKEKIGIHFIKLHAPFNLLCHYAEKLNYAMPYKDLEDLDEFPDYQYKQNMNSTLIEKLGFHFLIPEVPLYLKQSKYRTKIFVNKHQQKYHGIENKQTFFSSGQRCGIVEYILKTTSYGYDPFGLKTGIDKLIKKKLFTDAYPLHEGCENQEIEDIGTPLTERQFLKLNWASFKPRAFFKTQPLPQIRHYLGEKVAIYFAWLGFYTKWLHISTIIGFLIFTIGPYTLKVNLVEKEVCEQERGALILCPSCMHNCDFEALDESCFLLKISNILDNEGTIMYAAFMSLWAVLFLEFWKRYQFYLQYEWDLLDYEPLEESPRPHFINAMRNRYKNARNELTKKKIWKVNPITGKTEFFQEPTQIKLKLLVGLSVTLTLVITVISILIGIIFYRAAIAPLISQVLVLVNTHEVTSLIAITSFAAAVLISTTAGVIQLIFIFIMNAIYRQLAVILTKWELNRTQSEHENSFTIKMSLFQFVNFYASLMYIAFLKGRLLTRYPGRNIFSGIDGLEPCAEYGCLLELTFQLVVIFALKQTMNNIKELATPLIKVGIRKFYSLMKKKMDDEEKVKAPQPPWERDRKLEAEDELGLFEEYLELVIQFGFVTIFAAAFPLAPLLALVNNYFEIRLDAIKYLRLTRRIVPTRVQDIGPWYSLLDGIAKFAVISNSLLIPFLGSPVGLWVYSSNFPEQGKYLNKTLVRIPIKEFVNTDSFPDASSRKLMVNTVKFEDTFLSNTTTFYCRNGGMSGCMQLPVNIMNITNIYNTDCCSLLNETGNGTESDCTLSNGIVYCCVDADANVEFLDTSTYSGDNTNCCGIVYEYITRRNKSSDSRTFFNRTGEEETKNPQDTSFNSCTVNIVDNSAVCRFYSGYEIIEYMTEEQKELYYKTLLYKVLFAAAFEHIVFLTIAVVAYIVPDVPEPIQNQIRRDKHISKFGSKSKGVRRSRPSIFEKRHSKLSTSSLEMRLSKISEDSDY